MGFCIYKFPFSNSIFAYLGLDPKPIQMSGKSLINISVFLL